MMRKEKLKTQNIIKNYWNGNFNKGLNITIIKEKKIDILTNYTTNNNSNAKET